MNARIQELMVQAGITTNLETDLFDDEGNIGKWLDHFAEEFAELIVQECAKVCYNLVNEIYEARVPMLYEANKRIKEHFGVES